MKHRPNDNMIKVHIRAAMLVQHEHADNIGAVNREMGPSSPRGKLLQPQRAWRVDRRREWSETISVERNDDHIVAQHHERLEKVDRQ